MVVLSSPSRCLELLGIQKASEGDVVIMTAHHCDDCRNNSKLWKHFAVLFGLTSSFLLFHSAACFELCDSIYGQQGNKVLHVQFVGGEVE